MCFFYCSAWEDNAALFLQGANFPSAIDAFKKQTQEDFK